MPRFLNAAVLRRFRPWLTAAWLIQLIQQRNSWLAAVLRRFVCGGCGGSRKPAENNDAAVLRRLRWLNPHTPYAPLARFRGAQGVIPGGATSRLARFLFDGKTKIERAIDRHCPSLSPAPSFGWPFLRTRRPTANAARLGLRPARVRAETTR
jgi:hypothetical protein